MNKLNDSIKRVKYGNTSLYVPRICQGTAFRNMPRADDNQIGLKVLQHSLDIGSNFFDTAPGYGAGGAQRLLGKALSGRRHQAIIADRILNRDIPLDGKEGDEFPLAKYTKEYIFNATEKSLKRINTDYLDILSIHLKDGFVQNQQSKAHLIAAIHQLLNYARNEKYLSYFPSYEIMMDELRDYRFYEEDMIHPNKTSINYIWDKFSENWFSDRAIEMMKEISKILLWKLLILKYFLKSAT